MKIILTFAAVIKSNNIMKTIKADKESTRNFVSYEINGEYYEAWGEFFFNKKKNRWEHEHIGKRGGKYLIVW